MKILKTQDKENINENIYPVLPLRDMVVFPGVLKTFYVGRPESIEAVNISTQNYEKHIFLVTQINSDIEKPELTDLHQIGVVSEIVEIRPGPDKKIIKLLVRGISRAKINRYFDDNGIKKVKIDQFL